MCTYNTVTIITLLNIHNYYCVPALSIDYVALIVKINDSGWVEELVSIATVSVV